VALGVVEMEHLHPYRVVEMALMEPMDLVVEAEVQELLHKHPVQDPVQVARAVVVV
jgi:hypothetical protein|tara:strand:+ start:483 stop:650 length:168 start_codon:yes stop_codon:yes gene_type:complete